MYAYFNFSDTEQTVYFDAVLFGKELLSSEEVNGLGTELKPYGFLWILCD